MASGPHFSTPCMDRIHRAILSSPNRTDKAGYNERFFFTSLATVAFKLGSHLSCHRPLQGHRPHPMVGILDHLYQMANHKANRSSQSYISSYHDVLPMFISEKRGILSPNSYSCLLLLPPQVTSHTHIMAVPTWSHVSTWDSFIIQKGHTSRNAARPTIAMGQL